MRKLLVGTKLASVEETVLLSTTEAYAVPMPVGHQIKKQHIFITNIQRELPMQPHRSQSEPCVARP